MGCFDRRGVRAATRPCLKGGSAYGMIRIADNKLRRVKKEEGKEQEQEEQAEPLFKEAEISHWLWAPNTGRAATSRYSYVTLAGGPHEQANHKP